MILKDVFLSIDGVDLSDHVQSIDITYGTESQDDTAMGDNTRQSEPGLFIHSLSATLYQDYSAGKTDATLFPLVGNSGFPVIVRPNNAAASATNPEFSNTMILTSYPPIMGAVGDEHTVTVEFAAAGDLSRATA